MTTDEIIARDAERITVWFCEICGYWRKEKATGRHQTDNPQDPRGKLVVHDLIAVEFIHAATLVAEIERLRAAGDHGPKDDIERLN